ncbi:hypothetical protein [Ignatzschineria cameli]|uniref:hypothetical protein n=1 Tax=Ignatzschineria cameli TaxID=2182793 RepID=UPI0010578ECD|nr:hypothetical protein [Ignatzschineria cameli]
MSCRRLLLHPSTSCMPAIIVTFTMNHIERKKSERCRILLSRSSINHAPADGIEDASRRAGSGDKSAIVGSRRSMNLLKNHQ